MMPGGDYSGRVTLHMDHFYFNLQPGRNNVTRDEMDAPHLSQSRWSLSGLQDSLMNGQMNRRDFSWGGCGWPRHLNVPRGTTGRGMAWTVVAMVSPVLPQDRSRVNQWIRSQGTAWSYCGVRGGLVPDSRPLGFPFDRSSNIQRLMGSKSNWFLLPVQIIHA